MFGVNLARIRFVIMTLKVKFEKKNCIFYIINTQKAHFLGIGYIPNCKGLIYQIVKDSEVNFW